MAFVKYSEGQISQVIPDERDPKKTSKDLEDLKEETKKLSIDGNKSELDHKASE